MFLLLGTFFFPIEAGAKLIYQDFIFGNGSYNKNQSPFDVTGQFVGVNILPSFIVLFSVEENRQLVSYVGCFNLTWKDERLAYRPDEFNGARSMVVPMSLLWIPYFYCYNCIEMKRMEKASESDDAIVYPDGTVSAYLRARYDTICECDIAAFPFDTQFCQINFDGGWGTFEQMNFYPYIDLPLMTTLGTPEWNMEYWNSTNVGPDLGYDYISTTIIYKLKRNPEFYFYFMILPTLIITCVCLAALLLPSSLSYGEKTTMGITGLLGLTFLLSILVSEVPRSKVLPLIGKWLLIEMFFCIISIALIAPLDRLKKLQFFEKRMNWIYAVDIIVFLIVFGANSLTTLFMLIFPGGQNTELKKYF